MRLSTSIVSLTLISGAAGFAPTNIKSRTRTRSSINTIHINNNSNSNNKLVRHTNVATTRTRLTMAMKDAADLTSALAKIDSQQNTRSSKRPTGGKAGWTKLILENDKDSSASSSEEEAYALPKEQEFVYLLEPPSTPSMIILFLGGAGLGQFPHIAYSELLFRISKRLNAAVITAPYPLSLDHFELAKKAGEALRRATVQCEEMGNYDRNLPKFYLGHSLGSKLLGIALAASGVRDVDGIGFMSYNNFGFKNTISMVKTFADDFNKNGGFGGGNGSAGAGGSGGFGAGMPNGLNVDQILDFAGEAASMMGFEFKPDPDTMDRIVEMKFDENLQKKTRMFIFDDDDLDSSQSFLDACKGSGSGPSVSRLQGTHLSPVYLKLGIDDLDLPEQAMPFVSEASGGFQNASFGDEDAMNGAVNEICNWIMGQEPSMPPLLSAGKAKAGDNN